ncbi:MAG: SDR family NAD(P)-dependent oxidoreductase [Smithellaceae bacterium]
MMFSLKGKVAVVTGGGQGIGRACCLTLAQQQADVAILDRKIETAKMVQDEIERMGRKAVAYQVDITQLPDVIEAVEKIINTLGKIDIWINNAGWDKVEPFITSTEKNWDRIIATNLRGTINCCHAVLSHMISQGGGKIINIGSDAGRTGSPGEAVYSATKGGIIAFTKTLALELAKSNIQVNCICPGVTDTPLLQQLKSVNPSAYDALAKAAPMGRLAQPEEIAAGVVFFASGEASFVTGQTLSINGGLTMV